MGRIYQEIDESLARFIEEQPVFFVATSPLDADGLVNCSPKGNRHELVVIAPDRIAYLEQTGSGIETVAHLLENGRIVIMVCAFEGPPRIVRIHGRGRAHGTRTADFDRLAELFPTSGGVGVRSIIEVEIVRIADSCGYGVPLMEFREHRGTIDRWSARKGPGGIATYQAEKNATSIGGLTGLLLGPLPEQ